MSTFNIGDRVTIKPYAKTVYGVTPPAYNTATVLESGSPTDVRVHIDGDMSEAGSTYSRTFFSRDLTKVEATAPETMVTLAQIVMIADRAIRDHGHMSQINGIVSGLRFGYWIDNRAAREGQVGECGLISLDTGETKAVFFTNDDAADYRRTLPARTEVPLTQVQEHVRRVASIHGWCPDFEPYLARLDPAHPNVERFAVRGDIYAADTVGGGHVTITARVDPGSGALIVNANRLDRTGIAVQFSFNETTVGDPQ